MLIMLTCCCSDVYHVSYPGLACQHLPTRSYQNQKVFKGLLHCAQEKRGVAFRSVHKASGIIVQQSSCMRTHLSFISNQLLITNTFSFLCYSKDSFKSNPDSNVFFQVAVSVAASHPSIIHNPVLMRQLTPRDISQTARERPALCTHIRSESLQPSSLRPA